jgi:pimeloyl-ACP methyl ester carboxylesterase
MKPDSAAGVAAPSPDSQSRTQPNPQPNLPSEPQQPQQGSYAHVNGLKLYYEIHGPDFVPDTGPAPGSDPDSDPDSNQRDGADPPLVLLHGGALTIGLSFGAVLPALAASRRVIAVELQGHGHTADSGREMSVQLLAEDVVGLLDVLGVERADLFGFSIGGMAALEAAVRRPERVGRLVLASVWARPDGYVDEIRDPALREGSRRMPTRADFGAMAEAYAAVAPDPTHFEALAAKCGGAVAAHEGWSDEDLRGITAPTLLVIGDTDFVSIGHAADMRDLIPDARLAVLPDCTHMDVTRRAELIVPMLESFLTR